MEEKHPRGSIVCPARGEGLGHRGPVCLLALVGLFFLALTALEAQPGPSLELTTTVEKEVRVQKSGTWLTERAPLEKSRPGDRLVYTIAYRNAGKSPIVEATIVDPIPPETVYRLDSAEGKEAEITCSVDGGRSYQKPPVMLRVKRPDGTEESKPAPAERYTHIKWVIKKPVAPGETGRVSLQVTVR